jgi:hypothetical protein
LARVRALRALLRSISTTDGRASKTLDRDGATATLLVGIDHRTAIDLVRDWHHIVGPYQTGMPSLSAAELVKKGLGWPKQTGPLRHVKCGSWKTGLVVHVDDPRCRVVLRVLSPCRTWCEYCLTPFLWPLRLLNHA